MRSYDNRYTHEIVAIVLAALLPWTRLIQAFHFMYLVTYMILSTFFINSYIKCIVTDWTVLKVHKAATYAAVPAARWYIKVARWLHYKYIYAICCTCVDVHALNILMMLYELFFDHVWDYLFMLPTYHECGNPKSPWSEVRNVSPVWVSNFCFLTIVLPFYQNILWSYSVTDVIAASYTNRPCLTDWEMAIFM